MLLAIDQGNTHTVNGLYDGDTLLKIWRHRTDAGTTVDEWGLKFKNFFELSGKTFDLVSGTAISSVVPQALGPLAAACLKYFGSYPLVVEPGIKTGLPILYDNPHEVGADRIVNSVGAYNRVCGACIVVDFGTAITMDCISTDGEYLGGAITPGVSTSLDALCARTAKLPRVELKKPKNVLGRNTVESMQSGIIFGYASLVDGLVKKLIAKMEGNVKVIATGGSAKIFAKECEMIKEHFPHLTLEGLNIIYKLNK